MNDLDRMIPAHLYSLDLTVLLALDALLDEQSVTKAAKRLGLTQPAVSRVLARARGEFDDALLVRAGRDLVMTPRAQRLRGPLREALLALDAVVREAPVFDPSTAERTFVLSTADYGAAVASGALAALAVHSPKLTVDLRPQTPNWDEALRSGAHDAALFPQRQSSPGIVWSTLFQETWVCLVRQQHPTIRGRLSLEHFCEVPQVFVSPALEKSGQVDRALARLGRQRRIALRMTTFLAAPLAVAQSDLIAVVPKHIAQHSAPALSLQQLPVPVPLQPFSVALAWHERSRSDAGHQWFRRQLASALKQRASRS